jgi:hypothetical protein
MKKKMLSGRFDRLIWSEKLGVALIQDFKTGFSEPDPAEQNAQLKVLAVLAALSLPPTLKEVIVQIISGPFGVTEARYDLPALARAYSEILTTLRAIQSPRAPLKPSPEACRYCAAKLICPAVQEKRVALTRLNLTLLPDGVQAALILDDVAVIRSRCDQIVEYYERRLLDDPAYELPGYAMIPNAPRREIKDVVGAKLRLAEFLDDSELNVALDLKVGQVEELFGKKVKLRGKELREKFNAVMKGVIVEKTPKPSLKKTVGKPKLVEIQLP